MKAPTTVSPDFRIEIGPPTASKSAVEHRAGKFTQACRCDLGSLLSAVLRCGSGRPSFSRELTIFRRKRLQADRLSLHRVTKLA